MPKKPKRYAIVDVETTGGDPRRDRITEIGIVLHDGQQELETFSSLVNPRRAIPDFITNLTGIDNDMVRTAPYFEEIAREVVELTEGAIFIGHRVRFDYSFVQGEFRRLGYTFSRKQLCTVELSRKIIPGLKSYSLSSLCRHLKVTNTAPHRALGDAQATAEVFRMLIERNADFGDDFLGREMADIKLPPKLSRQDIEDLPQAPGVYYFIDEDGAALYVGKSNNIRKRVLSHFQAAYRRERTIRLIERIGAIAHEMTGSDLMAQLLENEEIKRLQPPFNRAQRRTKFKYGLFLSEGEEGYVQISSEKLKDENEPLAFFSTRPQAEGALERLTREYELCARLNGLESGKGRCFHYQLHLCHGACAGEEEPESYNERVQQAVSELSYGRPDLQDFLVLAPGRDEDEFTVAWIEKGLYRGHGYLEGSLLSASADEIRSALPYRDEVPDVMRILRSYIRSNPKSVFPLS